MPNPLIRVAIRCRTAKKNASAYECLDVAPPRERHVPDIMTLELPTFDREASFNAVRHIRF